MKNTILAILALTFLAFGSAYADSHVERILDSYKKEGNLTFSATCDNILSKAYVYRGKINDSPYIISVYIPWTANEYILVEDHFADEYFFIRDFETKRLEQTDHATWDRKLEVESKNLFLLSHGDAHQDCK
jgi:hypothetical protein